jgi:chromate reductase, NAD(P)H dehydrogenase (quinone)
VIAELLSHGKVVVEQFNELAAVAAFDPVVADDDARGAVSRLRSHVGAVDVVIIATPEYAGGMAGALKNALDWIVGTGEFDRKPAIVISAGTTGGVHARRQLIRTLAWQGAHVVDELGISGPRTKMDEAGAFTDGPTLDALRALARVAFEAPTMDVDRRRSLVHAVLDGAEVERRDL